MLLFAFGDRRSVGRAVARGFFVDDYLVLAVAIANTI
jgi:hypothetical protein